MASYTVEGRSVGGQRNKVWSELRGVVRKLFLSSGDLPAGMACSSTERPCSEPRPSPERRSTPHLGHGLPSLGHVVLPHPSPASVEKDSP